MIEKGTTFLQAFPRSAATARDPSPHVGSWGSTYGKRRVYENVLGHDVEAMQSAGFQTLLIRGVEWAATGETSYPLPAELKGK